MEKSLKFFMRQQEEEIVTMPAPASFTDDNGNVLDLEIRVLPQEEIDKINAMYRRRSIATDKKGNPLVSNQEVIWKTERDNAKATRHLVVEALVYPDLKDKQLMDFYKCVDITDMPLKVFSKSDEYQQVLRSVLQACGIQSEVEDEESELNEAKN